ncbi:hypothetical protein [Pseudonocardia nigra]|uniref:hypothetical protein n=1 Tax=Pseudonocardia nigra TaxID=1921578 RepID=UPI001C5D5F45|nr:hypothetical protein [Pseudonocardia nigra]
MQHGETLGLLDADGVRGTCRAAGATLLAAGGPGAWLAEIPYIDVGEAGPDGTWGPAPPLPDGRIVLVTPDRRHREIRLDRPVSVLAADPGGLLVTVSERPPEAIPTGPGGNTFDYHRTTLIVPWQALGADRIVCADHPRVERRHTGNPGWLRPRPHAGWWAGGLWWSGGWDPAGSKIDRPLLAVGVDDEGAEQARVALGRGSIRAGCIVGERIWLAVWRGRFLHVDADAPADVVVLDPVARRVAQALAPDAVVIAAHCWPPPSAPPAHVMEHAEQWLGRFAGLEAFWTDEAGATAPLAAGMTDARAALDGEWPDLAVRVTFRHPYFPGGLLSRRIPLVDELGRPVEPEYADIGLMEDLDTGYLPPMTEAVDGILEI